MRSVELARVAAAAEALRLRRLARRQAIRAVLGVTALLFAIAAFALLHLVAYDALILVVSPWLAALIVFAVDLLIAGTLATIAVNSTPDRIEREALEVRREALAEAKRALTVMAVVGEAAGLAVSSSTRRALRGPKLGRIMLLADIASRLAPRVRQVVNRRR
jgi:hypothetical protein